MKRIQKMIPTAMDVADRNLKNGQGQINKEFNGYISSFGSSIISAGLLPSVIFFSQKGESASNRHEVILCIEKILQQHGPIGHNIINEVKVLYQANPIDHATISRLTDSISDAAVALKLAIRTFPKTKKD